MEAASVDLEKRMEVAVEATEIYGRGMKEAAEEAEVKAATTKATAKASDSVSFAGTMSAATASSTAKSAVVRYTNSTSSVVGAARRSGYTLITIML